MNRLVSILAIVGVTALASCGQQKTREHATQYHESFMKIIGPYKAGTEKIMDQTKLILQNQISNKGFIGLTGKDSIEVIKYFDEFEELTAMTVLNLEKMEAFADFDLRQPSINYVRKCSAVIGGAYKEFLFPTDQTDREKLVKEFTTEFLAANESFADTQRKFLDEFGLH